MEISSPHHHHHHHHHNNNNPLPSPNSSKSSTSSTTTNNNNNNNGPKSPSTTTTTLTRSDPTNPYPTTFVQADTSSFKQVVQMLTGSSSPKPKSHPIPPIKPSNKSRPSTKLYERRSNSFKHHLNISPLLPTPLGNSSPRYINNNNYPVSPSMLDFPSLMLSPVTPLIYDPFTRSPLSSDNSSPIDKVAEDKAIAEKGFFLHPVSPNSKPRLLPLFPVTSPKVSSL